MIEERPAKIGFKAVLLIKEAIGSSVAQRLAREGTRVIVVDILPLSFKHCEFLISSDVIYAVESRSSPADIKCSTEYHLF